MSCVQLSEGGFQVVYALGLWSGAPELSNSHMDMASKLFTFTFTFTMLSWQLGGMASREAVQAKPATEIWRARHCDTAAA